MAMVFAAVGVGATTAPISSIVTLILTATIHYTTVAASATCASPSVARMTVMSSLLVTMCVCVVASVVVIVRVIVLAVAAFT